MRNIPLREIAEKYGLHPVGDISGAMVTFPGSLKKQGAGALMWLKKRDAIPLLKTGYVITNIREGLEQHSTSDLTFLITDQSPRLVFAKIVGEYFVEERRDFVNHADEHRKNPRLIIGENCFIAKDVEIGDGTIIYPNVVILENTRIGRNCVIQSHVSLGTEGLGLEMDPETNEYVKFPQIGGVIIEDNVEIGPSSTIRRSALDDTIIRSGTKLGALVNIGHNCIIGRNCIFTCQIVTSGSSTVGDNVMMGVNSLVKNGVNIGNNCTIGQGAVVTKHVPDGATYVGNPAIDIKEYTAWSKLKKKLFGMFGTEEN